MTRLATSFVLGFHGCDSATGRKAIEGEIDLLHSDEDYDWLGPGTYFWESDPVRAREWAESKASRGDYSEPAVIGAVIDLRHCLDLTNREDLEVVCGAYEGFRAKQEKAGLPMPANRRARGSLDEDLTLRFLDCAVLRHLHSILEQSDTAPYDTVRGMFTEGGPLYEGSGFQRLNHTQIAVRNNACILGLFWPRQLPENAGH